MSTHANESGHGRTSRTESGAAEPNLVAPELVEQLTESILAEPRTRHLGGTRLPSREAVRELVEMLRQLAFPGFFGRRGLTADSLPLHVQSLASRILLAAQEEIRAVLRYVQHVGPERADALDSAECDRHAAEAAMAFVNQLPGIRAALALDVQAAYDGDPAAIHTDETVFCYPGVDAIFAHRIAHALHRLGVPLLPRIIQEQSHSRTGIDINPGATIGPSFFIDHGGGVVIGETCVIGAHVKIYQGVTLGARSFNRDQAGRLIRDGTKRHPTIGNRVTIYAGAVILGGDTEIGDDCVVSGGVFITQSVPPGHLVRQKQPELVLRSHAAQGGA